MIENFHSLLTSIEELYETEKFNGPEERFFNIVEKVSSNRPVSKTALVVVISTKFLLRERRSKDYHDRLVRMRGRPSFREVLSSIPRYVDFFTFPAELRTGGEREVGLRIISLSNFMSCDVKIGPF